MMSIYGQPVVEGRVRDSRAVVRFSHINRPPLRSLEAAPCFGIIGGEGSEDRWKKGDQLEEY